VDVWVRLTGVLFPYGWPAGYKASLVRPRP